MPRTVKYRRYKTARKTKNTYYPFVLGKYGNYVGPGWSDGKYQNSVAYGKSKPVDKFDNTARSHDTKYALGKDLNRADEAFYAANIGRGPRRTVAAVAVMTQRKLRGNKQTSTEVGFPTQSSFSQKDMPRSRSPPRTPSKQRGRSPPRTPSKAASIKMKSRSRSRKSRSTSVTGLRRRKGGAAFSKSAGFIRKGPKRYTSVDEFSKKGVVVQREGSGIMVTDATEKAQSFMIGHANFATNLLKYDIANAWTKWIAKKLNYQIPDMLAIVPLPTGEEFELRFFYRVHAGIAESSTTYTIVAGVSWATVASNLLGVLSVADAQNNFYWTRLQCLRKVSGTNKDVRWNSDLTRMKINVYNKSALKIQNRTVNSSTDDDANDVDNVPLYGKMYTTSNSNYIMHQDIVYSPQNTSLTQPAQVGYRFPIDNPMTEPQALSFIKKATGTQKVHLDPGQIKTNVITFYGSKTLNGFTKLCNRSGTSISATFDMLNYGKASYIHVEKMIQAVATTAVNGITLAFEIDSATGVYITCPDIQQTNILSYTQQV